MNIEFIKAKGNLFRRGGRLYVQILIRKGEQIYWVVTALSRYIWLRECGPIPDGHQIHHIDGDPFNNRVDNLQCVSSEDHLRLHSASSKVSSLDIHQDS